MRFVILGVLVGCFCLDPIGSLKAASWTSAKFPGEQGRAVQGCVDSPQKVGDWLCIVVLCDHPGSARGWEVIQAPDREEWVLAPDVQLSTPIAEQTLRQGTPTVSGAGQLCEAPREDCRIVLKIAAGSNALPQGICKIMASLGQLRVISL